MSLYAEYILEREGYSCLEDSVSFITYKKIDTSLYLRDMYIMPEERRKGKARKLVNEIVNIAKRMKCERVITTVDKNGTGWEINEKGILTAGFTKMTNGELLYFVKEL